MKTHWNFLLKIVFALFFVTITSHADPTKNLIIGTTAGDFADMAKEGLKPPLEKQGYTVKVVEFTDYVTPNLALADGKIDVNIFQHKPYLEHFAKEKGLHLKPIAQVPTSPLGLYSGKLKSLKDIKEGSSIAMPNDATNLSRALTILADLGWIEISKNANPLLVGTRDITKNPKNLKITPLEAAQVPRATQDVDFAVINGNYATNAGIPMSSALTLEKSNLYVNWAVVAEKNFGAKFSQDLITVLNSEDFKKFAHKRFKGYKFPEAWKK